MSHVEVKELADELLAAYATGATVSAPPSSRDPDFDLARAYGVEAELTRARRAQGRTTVGRKVGYANKALWRKLKLDTLVWARMYDDTVHYARGNVASLSLAHTCSPKIEPEIVFKLKKPIDPADACAVLAGVEWLALGFEIVDCVFPDWKVQPADFVAAFGLHAALAVGEPVHVEPEMIAPLADQLPRFTARLLKDGQLVEEGSGKNSLGSPALCLGELAAAVAHRPGAEALTAGELVSSGSLTTAHPVAEGQHWSFEVEGLDWLAPLEVRFPIG
jgi:2-oxo-3-hexenedioate decarboxylase